MVPSDSGILSEYQGVTGIPRKLWALMGHKGVGEGRPQGGAWPPPKAVRIGLWGGGTAPSFLSLSLSFPPSSSPERKGSPTRIGSPSWTPLYGAPPRPAASSLPPLYTGEGAPQRHNRQSLSRVRCPPPQFNTLVISS